MVGTVTIAAWVVTSGTVRKGHVIMNRVPITVVLHNGLVAAGRLYLFVLLCMYIMNGIVLTTMSSVLVSHCQC